MYHDRAARWRGRRTAARHVAALPAPFRPSSVGADAVPLEGAGLQEDNRSMQLAVDLLELDATVDDLVLAASVLEA